MQILSVLPGYSYVLEEEAVTNTALLEAIDHVFSHKERYVEANGKSKVRFDRCHCLSVR